MASCNISVILPYGGRYSATAHPGAIELCVKDFVQESRFFDDLVVIGNPIDKPYHRSRFLPLSNTVIRKRRLWYQSLKDKIKTLQPKVIQVQQHPGTAAFLKRQFPKVPVILHLHDTQVPSFFVKAFFRRQAIRMADVVVTNSTFTKTHLCEVIGVPKDRVRVVYNALRPPLLPMLPKRSRKIVCVSGMLERKAPHLFIEAVLPLLKKYPDWRANLVCWECPGTTQDYKELVDQLLGQAPQNFDRFEWMSHEDILRQFADAEIAVVPSQLDEGFGRTALEAALHGAAVISSGRGGLKEITGCHGFYPEQQTSDDYRKCIERLIVNENLRLRRQQSVYDYAKENFSLYKMAAWYDEIMAAAIAGRSFPLSYQG